MTRPSAADSSRPDESATGDTDVRTVQRAALQRAVLAADRTRHYLAFAAALEPARVSTAAGTGRRQDAVAVALVATAATTVLTDIQSLGAAAPSPRVPGHDPWQPGTERPPDELVVDGAALACRLLDVSPQRVATVAAVSPEAVRAALDGASAEP